MILKNGCYFLYTRYFSLILNCGFTILEVDECWVSRGVVLFKHYAASHDPLWVLSVSVLRWITLFNSCSCLIVWEGLVCKHVRSVISFIRFFWILHLWGLLNKKMILNSMFSQFIQIQLIAHYDSQSSAECHSIIIFLCQREDNLLNSRELDKEAAFLLAVEEPQQLIMVLPALAAENSASPRLSGKTIRAYFTWESIVLVPFVTKCLTTNVAHAEHSCIQMCIACLGKAHPEAAVTARARVTNRWVWVSSVQLRSHKSQSPHSERTPHCSFPTKNSTLSLGPFRGSEVVTLAALHVEG